MLQLSPQVNQNLAASVGRFASRAINSSYINWPMCVVLVSNVLTVPTSGNGAIAYINSALNGSSYNGGTPGNEVNCLGIIDTISSATYANSSTMTFDGIAQFTAKQTGTIGGAIFLPLYSTTSLAPSTIFPLTSATTLANSNTYTGATNSGNAGGVNKIWNYFIITDSVSTSGDSMVVLDSLNVVAGQTYNFFASSFKFTTKE